jgi:3-oxosteroid 1-dehydrogenase
MGELDTDVVLAGSGAAGCGAALAAVARGLRVVVAEKSERLGGATASSLGGLWVPASHLLDQAARHDSLDGARRYMRFLGGGYALAPMMEAYPRHLNTEIRAILQLPAVRRTGVAAN